MEDDDEFGDLYTDVLTTFPSSATAEQPLPSSTPVDLKSPRNVDEEIASEALDSGFGSSSKDAHRTLVSEPPTGSVVAEMGDSGRNSDDTDELTDIEVGEDGDLAGVSGNWALNSANRAGSRVLESGDEKSNVAREDPDGGAEPCIGFFTDGDDRAGFPNEKCDNFDVREGDTGIRDVGSEPIIPGLLIQEDANGVENGAGVYFPPMEDFKAEADDWDSDSEDDLQILLNDNTHGPMAMDGGAAGGDDEDEDGEPLVIVDSGDTNHQQIEVQEWGEDATQPADADKKDVGEAGKMNGKTAAAPKVGYSSHGYHSFHSQFKYVRPGVPLMPGTVSGGPGGGPSQARPIGSMGHIAGRGRGDWRAAGFKAASSIQKNFHSGSGMPWGNNMLGRGFGLEFTLPSHKTVFEVDIDGFEEKPWKLPGVDISDFFNFGLNEDSWKDYCKQLEQLRMEATMQSKIRVYESGRTEQEYDPDLPPELAAATVIYDVTAENANAVKRNAGQGGLDKVSSRVRPPFPTGRAIQVESGYGDRLPSIDTRPPRIRDSDAIIEIVLQNPQDSDSSAVNDVLEKPDNDPQREDFSAAQGKNGCPGTEYYDKYPLACSSRKRELDGKRDPFTNSAHANMPEGGEDEPIRHHLGTKGQASEYCTRDFVSPNEERQTKGRLHDGSPLVSPSRSSQDKTFFDNENERSVESIDCKHSLLFSSPVTIGVDSEQRDDQKVNEQDEHIPEDGNSRMERDDITLDTVDAVNIHKDEDLLYPVKKQKLSSRVELQETEVTEDLKAKTENSKAKLGSSSSQGGWDGLAEELMQDQHSTDIGDTQRQIYEDDSSFRRNDHNAKPEIERYHVVAKGREESYSNSACHLHMKNEVLDRRKERDVFNTDGAWQKRDEDPHGRTVRAEGAKKRECSDETGTRHKSKFRESERSDKDEHLNSRKQVDRGSWRGHHDKELGSRHRERDDSSKGRNDDVGDLQIKKKKDEEYPRRDNAHKEEVLHGYRESTNLRKRERDEISDQRKRNDQGRIRDKPDDHHSLGHKDGSWLKRERSERQRERERVEWSRVKLSQEENLPRWEREEGRGVVRSARGTEDKGWVIHARVKDDYSGSDKDHPIKEAKRHSKQHKRKGQIEDESIHRIREDVYACGNQFISVDKKSRQERSSTRNDRMDNRKVQEKKRKENMRKSKESDSGADHNSSLHSKRSREDLAGQVNLKGTSEKGNRKKDILQSSRKQREGASSDDQQDFRRGRSKLERWTSHRERDYSIITNSSSSRVKDIDMNKNGQSSLADKLPDESPKAVETEEGENGGLEIDDADMTPLEDRHLDTVAKLKKRRERFKAPLPSEKEPATIQKTENESLHSKHNDAPAGSAIKQERPARKRRWISN